MTSSCNQETNTDLGLHYFSLSKHACRLFDKIASLADTNTSEHFTSSAFSFAIQVSTVEVTVHQVLVLYYGLIV